MLSARLREHRAAPGVVSIAFPGLTKADSVCDLRNRRRLREGTNVRIADCMAKEVHAAIHGGINGTYSVAGLLQESDGKVMEL